jgi:hypothetical protein
VKDEKIQIIDKAVIALRIVLSKNIFRNKNIGSANN